MERILNYKKTNHFNEQTQKRHFDEFIISLCLAKGTVKKINKNKKQIILSKDKIIEASKQGYISLSDYKGLKKLIIIVKKNILITAFGRYGDTGILQF